MILQYLTIQLDNIQNPKIQNLKSFESPVTDQTYKCNIWFTIIAFEIPIFNILQYEIYYSKFMFVFKHTWFIYSVSGSEYKCFNISIDELQL